MLQGFGFGVLVARDGVEAVETFRAHSNLDALPDATLAKPYTVEQLLATLQQVIRRP